MIHQMKLYNKPFEMIKNGTKKIELRLNDEKRSLIKISDVIEFTNIINKETIRVIVTNLYLYKNFHDLYLAHDKTLIGYLPDEGASPDDMLEYYSTELIEKYGVLGIEVKVINNDFKC